MSEERKETWADIVAEMREPDVRANSPDISKRRREVFSLASDWLADYADRIDAACKRESGNAAKLREALENIRRFVSAWIAAGVIDKSMAKSILVNCDAALAAPPRNCDVGNGGGAGRSDFPVSATVTKGK